MPIYEFQCAACDEIFEEILKIDAPHPSQCAQCGKGPVTKIMSLPSNLGFLTDERGEEEDYLVEKGSKWKYQKERADNMVQDSHGHWVEMDPKDPKLKEIKKKKKEEREKGFVEGRKGLKNVV